MRLNTLRATLLVLALLAPALSRAQSLTGAVFLPDSTPAAGAVIQVTNTANGVVARTLASTTGSYSLRLAGAGRYEMRVLRIGFEPTVLPPFDLQVGESRMLRVVFHGARIVLPTVTVAENRSCRVNPDTALGVVRAWNEARSALMATQLSAGALPLIAERVDYDRTTEVAGSIVRSQRVRSSRTPVTTVWQSLPPDTLAAHGFAVDKAGAMIFYAPDAAVLLSESFAATHCFRLRAPPPEHPELLGVQFEPNSTRSAFRDITGVFWLDRATAELRSVDYQYTNLDAERAAAGAGGAVEFLRLRTGEWIVTRWSLHSPLLTVPAPSQATGVPLRSSATRLIADGENVTGGEVLSAVRGDTVLYKAAGHELNVQFTAPDSGSSVAYARIELAGTQYSATADASGHVSLSPVVEGTFIARIATALMDSLGGPLFEREVTVGSVTHVDSIPLAPSQDLVRRICAADSLKRGPVMLRGSVRTAAGSPIPFGDVTVTWRGAASKTGNSVAQEEYSAGVVTDASGTWRVCGVPADRPVIVRVDSDSGSATRDVRIPPRDFIVAADLTVSSSLNRPSERRTRALVEFLAIGAGGARISGVTLEVTTGSGSARTVLTNDAGRALLPDLPPGVVHVRARRIGFKPGEISAKIAPGRNTVPIILGKTSLPSLDTVRVVGDEWRSTKNDEFDTRRLRRQATASFDEADITKRAPGQLWELLQGAPSVDVQFHGGTQGAIYPMSARAGHVAKMMPKGLDFVPCYMAVMIDGVVLRNTYTDSTNAFDLRDLPPPSAVHGIEIFGDAASIPIKYAGAVLNDQNCGLIAVWTR